MAPVAVLLKGESAGVFVMEEIMAEELGDVSFPFLIRTRQPENRMEVAPENKAYAAGFFDGEGYVIIKSPKKGLNACILYVCVQQDDIRPLLWLKNLWRGSIYKMRPRANGKVARKWCVAARLALKFLEDIQPFLINKREQAAVAIEFQKGKRQWGNGGIPPDCLVAELALREKIYSFARKLNVPRRPYSEP